MEFLPPDFNRANADNRSNCAPGFHFASLWEIIDVTPLPVRPGWVSRPPTPASGRRLAVSLAWRTRQGADSSVSRSRDGPGSHPTRFVHTPRRPRRRRAAGRASGSHHREPPTNASWRRVRVCALVELGRLEEARAELAEVARSYPDFRISIVEKTVPPQPALLPRLIAAWRAAGAPE